MIIFPWNFFFRIFLCAFFFQKNIFRKDFFRNEFNFSAFQGVGENRGNPQRESSSLGHVPGPVSESLGDVQEARSFFLDSRGDRSGLGRQRLGPPQ